MVEMLGSILFFLFSEPWEEYTVSEVSDATMRFRLAEKYKGIVIHDMSLSGGDGGGSYDYYRVVVDLEWSSGNK